MIPGNRTACVSCGGRGWVALPGRDWPECCAACKGTGRPPKSVTLTLHALATRLDEYPSAIYRLNNMRVGAIVAGRLLGKLTALALAATDPGGGA